MTPTTDKKLRHAIADWLFGDKKNLMIVLMVLFGSGATMKHEILGAFGFKPAVSDTVELSDEDQRLLHDVAMKTDETAKVVAQLQKNQDQLATDFRQFLLIQATNGRSLSDARVSR